MAGLLGLLKKIPLLLVAVFFTYVFVSSSVVVTLLSLLLLFLWPVAATTYRRITSGLAYTVLGRESVFMSWLASTNALVFVRPACRNRLDLHRLR